MNGVPVRCHFQIIFHWIRIHNVFIHKNGHYKFYNRRRHQDYDDIFFRYAIVYQLQIWYLVRSNEANLKYNQYVKPILIIKHELRYYLKLIRTETVKYIILQHHIDSWWKYLKNRYLLKKKKTFFTLLSFKDQNYRVIWHFVESLMRIILSHVMKYFINIHRSRQ